MESSWEFTSFLNCIQQYGVHLQIPFNFVCSDLSRYINIEGPGHFRNTSQMDSIIYKGWSRCGVSVISVTDCLGSHLAKHRHNREHFGFRATALTSWRQIPEDCYTQSNNQNETQLFHQATRLHQVRIAFKDKLKQHGTACSGRSPGVQKFSLLKGASLILTTDDLHKNTVLPAHVLDVGFNSEGLKLGFACCSYTKLSYGSSGIKRDTTVDEEKLSVDGRRPELSSGESGNCSSRSIIPPLQTNILHEGRRHPRHVCDQLI
jgi:hypothetical protein